MACWEPWVDGDAQIDGEGLELSDGGRIYWSRHPDRTPMFELSWRGVEEATTDGAMADASRDDLRAAALKFARRTMRAHLVSTTAMVAELEEVE